MLPELKGGIGFYGIGNNPGMTQLSIGNIDVGTLDIENNPVLTGVNVSGRIRKQLVVRNNPALSSAHVNGWPVTLDPGATRLVVGNKVP